MMEGNFSVRFVLDRRRLRRLAPPDHLYIGQLSHAEHRNKSLDELSALWDAEHPDNPVEDA